MLLHSNSQSANLTTTPVEKSLRWDMVRGRKWRGRLYRDLISLKEEADEE